MLYKVLYVIYIKNVNAIHPAQHFHLQFPFLCCRLISIHIYICVLCTIYKFYVIPTKNYLPQFNPTTFSSRMQV